MNSPSSLPYTYIRCPCASEGSRSETKNGDDYDEEEKDFDPKSSRSSYSLYKLEELLYCEDCQEIRCPKCVLEEVVTWYCPNCLFEVPSSTVRSEGTRCTRSCYECPTCTAPLSVTATEPSSNPSSLSPDYPSSGQFLLSCLCCNWSTDDVGMRFDKSGHIHSQLANMLNTRSPHNDIQAYGDGHRRYVDRSDGNQTIDLDGGGGLQADDMSSETRFANLRSFYHSQMSESMPGGILNSGGDSSYGPPSSLSRIMGLYTGGGLAATKAKSNLIPMREALTANEGLSIISSATDRQNITKLRSLGFQSTAPRAQRAAQLRTARFVSDLHPKAYLLRTKRSKRCKSCRHILTKPESKVTNTRFKIRLVAINYLPKVGIKPFPYVSDDITAALPRASLSALSKTTIPQLKLLPRVPTQFILTLTNPLFEKIKVTLATPAYTPGRISSKITILCPQFEVGANTDVWDEALATADSKRSSRDTKNTVAEAGKLWDKGRNWSSVVVEVVPGTLAVGSEDFVGVKGQRSMSGEKMMLNEDENLLEVPIFIRIEWEADETGDGDVREKIREGVVKRELAYWCVLGVGQIEQV